MHTLDGTDGDEDTMQDCLEHEAKEVREEAQLLEASTHEAEQETKAQPRLHDVAQEMAGPYDVLNAAGMLVSIAKECLSRAPAKSELRAQLRDVVESATEIVNEMSEFIRHTLTAGRPEPPPEKDQKSSK
jgi:hypothetical protein